MYNNILYICGNTSTKRINIRKDRELWKPHHQLERCYGLFEQEHRITNKYLEK
jgi:hypothetical protein